MAMETFVWDSLFETGIRSVDEQHHHLVDLVNGLSDSLINAEKRSDGSLSSLVSKLADYAVFHFADEERMMREHRICERHFQHHVVSHRKFVEQISAMWNARRSMEDSSSVILQFLISWLSFHILGEDQSMSRQIGRIRNGLTPEEAYESESKASDQATTALLRAVWNLYHVMTNQNSDLLKANQLLEARVRELSLATGNTPQAAQD